MITAYKDGFIEYDTIEEFLGILYNQLHLDENRDDVGDIECIKGIDKAIANFFNDLTYVRWLKNNYVLDDNERVISITQKLEMSNHDAFLSPKNDIFRVIIIFSYSD